RNRVVRLEEVLDKPLFRRAIQDLRACSLTATASTATSAGAGAGGASCTGAATGAGTAVSGCGAGRVSLVFFLKKLNIGNQSTTRSVALAAAGRTSRYNLRTSLSNQPVLKNGRARSLF